MTVKDKNTTLSVEITCTPETRDRATKLANRLKLELVGIDSSSGASSIVAVNVPFSKEQDLKDYFDKNLSSNWDLIEQQGFKKEKLRFYSIVPKNG